MRKKIDVLMPSTSQYGVLHHFTEKLYEALKRNGQHQIRLLSGDERVYAPLASPPDFTIGFNGALRVEDDTFLCDHLKIPHIACIVDPPYRFLDLTKSPYLVIACDDLEGCSLLKRRHFDRTFFLPHAAEPGEALEDEVERIYDLVFLGTCIDAEKKKQSWKKRFGSKVAQIMEEAAEKTLADTVTSFIPLLESHFDPTDYQGVFEEVELYIKGIDRLRLLEAFPDRSLHVFGDGIEQASWQNVLKSKSNVTIHPPVLMTQAREIMKRTKIVLNSSIKNKQGGHERIFEAAACGAVVVTNDNPWMRKNFDDDKDLLFFNAGNLERLNLKIGELLANDSKRKQMAEKGRTRVIQAHTWDQRAQHLLKEALPMLKMV